MPNYIQDPDDPKKQIPAPKTDQHYDRVNNTVAFQFYKTPTFVHVNATISKGLGFFFGSSASFARKTLTEVSGASATAGGGSTITSLTGSQHYVQFDTLAAGQYHLNPVAVSGSTADVAKINFIYKGGLDGLGRP